MFYNSIQILSLFKKLLLKCYENVFWSGLLRGRLLLIIGVLFISGCEETVQLTLQETYQKAIVAYEDGTFQEAKTEFEKVIELHPGTLFSIYSYLKLGELHYETEEWEESELNYRLFLTHRPSTHLTPYVLFRLISLNYQKNVRGIFFESREFDRDMEPNREIILDYQRFFFLYRNNVYLEDTKDFLKRARNDLANHELLVGDYYFKRQAYDSAILRYIHLLKFYSEFLDTEKVGNRLVDAYEKNQQPELANEMRKTIEVRFAKVKTN